MLNLGTFAANYNKGSFFKLRVPLLLSTPLLVWMLSVPLQIFLGKGDLGNLHTCYLWLLLMLWLDSSKGDQGAGYWNHLCEKREGPEISSQCLAYRKCSRGDITSNGHDSGGISDDRWHPGCPLAYLLGSGIPLLMRERFEEEFFSFLFCMSCDYFGGVIIEFNGVCLGWR